MRRRAPVPPAVPWHDARPGLERAYRIDSTGRTGPTKGQADGRFWRTVGRGWFRPVEPPAGVEQRIVEASYSLPSYGGITGWAALRWMGGRWFTGVAADGSELPVPLAIFRASRNHREGVLLTKERVGPEELECHDGLPTTRASRSVLYEMRHAASVRAAVVALDMACFNDLVSIDELRRSVDASAGWTGIQQARNALLLAEENAWSPAEVGLRLTWTVDTGMGPLKCNQPVFDLHGRHLFTPDLLDVAAGVAGEYQGEHHFGREQRRRDLGREQELRAAGLEYVEFLGGDSVPQVLDRLRATYARAARMPVAERRWTTTPPAGWTSTTTVAERRRLSVQQRRVLLAHRLVDRAA